MKNNIFIYGHKLIEIKMSGRNKLFYLYNGDVFNTAQIKNKIEIECLECNKKYKLTTLYCGRIEKPYICATCRLSGEKNPFYGKRHTQELKDKLSNDRKGQIPVACQKNVFDWWVEKYGLEEAKKKQAEQKIKLSKSLSGENNPFYGKRHPTCVIQQISSNLKKYYKNNPQAKINLSKNAINFQIRQKEMNYDKYIEDKKRAAKASFLSQSRWQMNKIEKIVFDELQKRDISMKYSVILNFMQFDFGNKENRIFLEVQGDYWHGNPEIYSKLNKTQQAKVARDIEKYLFAKSNNFKIFYIWEKDINNKNYVVLDEIKQLLDSN